MLKQTLFKTIMIGIGTTAMGFYSEREREREREIGVNPEYSMGSRNL